MIKSYAMRKNISKDISNKKVHMYFISEYIKKASIKPKKVNKNLIFKWRIYQKQIQKGKVSRQCSNISSHYRKTKIQ